MGILSLRAERKILCLWKKKRVKDDVMKLTNSFSLSLVGLIALVVMFLSKGLDTSGSIVALCLGYIGARAGQKIGLGAALAKDPNSTLTDSIDKLNG
jgi:hypothetical protein